MKYLNYSELKEECIKSFENDNLTNKFKGQLSLLLRNTLHKYNIIDKKYQIIDATENKLIIYNIKNLLFSQYWKYFQIDKITEKHLPHHYYTEMIKKLILRSSNNIEDIKIRYNCERQREKLRNKLRKLKNYG